MNILSEAKRTTSSPHMIFTRTHYEDVIKALVELIEPPKFWPHRCKEFSGDVAKGQECSWCGAREA